MYMHTPTYVERYDSIYTWECRYKHIYTHSDEHVERTLTHIQTTVSGSGSQPYETIFLAQEVPHVGSTRTAVFSFHRWGLYGLRARRAYTEIFRESILMVNLGGVKLLESPELCLSHGHFLVSGSPVERRRGDDIVRV